MEEKNCCENNEKGCCGKSKHCYGSWKKHHGIKCLILIIIITIIFCMGSQWGEMKSGIKNPHFYKKMMSGDHNKFDSKYTKTVNEETGQVILDPVEKL